jgi:hypothetical protein
MELVRLRNPRAEPRRWPPTLFRGEHYVDGGFCSSNNADLATGSEPDWGFHACLPVATFLVSSDRIGARHYETVTGTSKCQRGSPFLLHERKFRSEASKFRS